MIPVSLFVYYRTPSIHCSAGEGAKSVLQVKRGGGKVILDAKSVLAKSVLQVKRGGDEVIIDTKSVLAKSVLKVKIDTWV